MAKIHFYRRTQGILETIGYIWHLNMKKNINLHLFKL